MTKVETGLHPIRGRYFRWGQFGTVYYVKDYGHAEAHRKARADGLLDRLSGRYTEKSDSTGWTTKRG